MVLQLIVELGLTPFAVLNQSEYYVSKLPAECKNGWGYAIN